jgi:ParB-like chromosome segregation protein Spo0J
MQNILAPVSNVQIVDRDSLKPNDYNPNKVLEQNLELLEKSILNNGWTMPIVIRPDMTIIDGFHRWTVAGREPLRTKLGGKVPVVIVEHKDNKGDVYGTITHNRARGTHLLGPMEKIIQDLLKDGTEPKEIATQLGMSVEEVWRLSGITREQFLDIMAGEDYNREQKRTVSLGSQEAHRNVSKE